jgi:lipoate-protein ligase A
MDQARNKDTVGLGETSSKWRLLLDSNSDPAVNLAVEEAIVRSRRDDFCPDTFRIWRNDRSVILGYNSSLQDEVNMHACKRVGIKVLRRTSGGGAVYHDLGNVNYSAIMKEKHVNPNHDILDVYGECAKAILNGLTFLNVKAEFQHPNSILLNGRKISGMAQHRFYDVILFHGTLLVNSDLELLSRTLLNPKYEVTNISEEGLGCPSSEAIEEAIIAGFRKTFQIQFDVGTLTPYESRLAEKLVAMKYGTEKWNLDSDVELTNESIARMPDLEMSAKCEAQPVRPPHSILRDQSQASLIGRVEGIGNRDQVLEAEVVDSGDCSSGRQDGHRAVTRGPFGSQQTHRRPWDRRSVELKRREL